MSSRFILIKNIFRVVFHVETFQDFEIFFSEGFDRMVFFLILDIIDDRMELRTGIRKSAKALLPIEFSSNPSLLIDES